MFSDRLVETIKAKKSYLCLGLDPIIERLPEEILSSNRESESNETTAMCNAIYEFNCGLIDACEEFIVCIKPQIAFYEMWGFQGYHVFQRTIEYARTKSIPVIADAKRGDISSTGRAYARAFLGDTMKADAVTVNPYLGSDGIVPFTSYKNKGIFVLLRTSNPGSKEVQMLPVQDSAGKTTPLYIHIAAMIKKLGEEYIGENGFSSVGAVAGATFPEEGKVLREFMPETFFLVPGIGAQGGKLSCIPAFFNDDMQGAVISLSRDINYAYQKSSHDYKIAAEKRARRLRDKINQTLGL